jgi:site-specific DNA-cytosine methylase
MKLLIGGSPCTHWSIAQKNNRETTAEGIGWELFKNYLIAKEKFQPDYFLYENNKSAAKPIKDQIAKELNVYDNSLFIKDTGVRMTQLNSALLSAQNRERFYVTNFGDIKQPQDKQIFLRNILESGETDKDKAYCLKHQAGNARDYFKKHHTNIVFERVSKPCRGSCEVLNGYITIKDKQYKIKLADGYYIIRKLTVKECCRLQTMPDDYCRAVSNSQAYKGLGNGWTAEVIIHLLNHALKDVPRNEPITVLSMYDGIGTGRYCLDKMGFTNITYYAYEIDKYAIQIAMSNYPDIIQCGDAFQVREKNWSML